MHSWDPLSPWFSVSDKFSPITGGVPTPAMIFPSLWEDHVNNHVSLGVSPPNMQTPCQVKVTPRKSEGIEPFTLVNSPPGQVKVSSSHPINTPLVPHKVIPSVSSWVPFSTSPIVAPVSLLPSSTSVLVPITDIAPPVTSPMSCTVPASASDCVTPVPSPSPSVPVSNPIAHGPSSVTSPSCSIASG